MLLEVFIPVIKGNPKIIKMKTSGRLNRQEIYKVHAAAQSRIPSIDASIFGPCHLSIVTI